MVVTYNPPCPFYWVFQKKGFPVLAKVLALGPKFKRAFLHPKSKLTSSKEAFFLVYSAHRWIIYTPGNACNISVSSPVRQLANTLVHYT